VLNDLAFAKAMTEVSAMKSHARIALIICWSTSLLAAVAVLILADLRGAQTFPLNIAVGFSVTQLLMLWAGLRLGRAMGDWVPTAARKRLHGPMAKLATAAIAALVVTVVFLICFWLPLPVIGGALGLLGMYLGVLVAILLPYRAVA
jgi:hypothetical protein